jgi:cell wall-associated NlpC family hydrolase
MNIQNILIFEIPNILCILQVMKKLFIIILVGLLPILGHSQTKKVYLDSIPRFATDSTLNTFVINWLRKPYRLGGSTEKGIDCSQLNKRLAQDVFKINIENTCSLQWETTPRVKKDSLQVGDLLFFRSKASPSRWHCGTYLGGTLFVHASNKYEGVKVSSINEPKYISAYRGAGRPTNL